MSQYFVNCDWGTTHFRLRAVDLGNWHVIAQIESDAGTAALAEGGPAQRADRFRQALLSGLSKLGELAGPPITSIPVAISGMASSTIGWHDLPYARTPARLNGSTLIWRDLGPIAEHPALLVSGVRSDNDVMRGEETQVLGVFAGDEPLVQGGETVIILPGTHSKHVWVADSQIQRFETFMTGELFAVLGEHSILRHSVGGAASGQSFTAQTTAAFRAGVDTAAALPLSAALFKVRTGQVLQNRPADESRAFLSGVLIGSELAHLKAPQNDRLPIVLAAADPLQTAYQTALDALALSARVKCISSQAQHLLSARGQAVLLRQIGWI